MQPTFGGRGRRADRARMWRLQELGGLELLRASYGDFVFTPHTHEGFLIALTEAAWAVQSIRGEQHQVAPGDILVLNPEVAHAGESVDRGTVAVSGALPEHRVDVTDQGRVLQRKANAP